MNFIYKWLKVIDKDGEPTEHWTEYVKWSKDPLPYRNCGVSFVTLTYFYHDFSHFCYFLVYDDPIPITDLLFVLSITISGTLVPMLALLFSERAGDFSRHVQAQSKANCHVPRIIRKDACLLFEFSLNQRLRIRNACHSCTFSSFLFKNFSFCHRCS